LPDDNTNHQDKDDNIDDYYGKNGSKKGTKKYSRITDEAAGGKK